MAPQRRPAVAGTFYESDPERLRAQVDACYSANPASTKQPFIGAVTPHAGLMYSGHVAAALYARLDLPKRLIILCPNHTGLGRPAAINTKGSWLTPFGAMEIDETLASALVSESPLLEEDSMAHAREHSLEVQLPLLQRIDPSIRFVPISLSLRTVERCRTIGEAIARVITRERPRGAVAILASSDMNHYEDQQATLAKDQRAIDRILALDPEGLWQTVEREDISMCGYIPTTTMLFAAKALGATTAALVKHATSGDVNGDYDAVVGYAAMVVS